MKNNFLLVITLLIFFKSFNLAADDLSVKSSRINIDKNTQVVFFEGSVEATDKENNKFFSDKAKYNKTLDLLESEGNTKIITSEGYVVTGINMSFDNKNKIISSNDNAKIVDKDGNEIYLEMFNYLVKKNMFFSQSNIKIIDINKNNYNFSEIYIDEKKNKILGSDVKVFLNQEGIKNKNSNDPRFFANSVDIKDNISVFQKGVFTYCSREKDKCPPWMLQSQKIEHDSTKKTIYYKDAVLKIYDFPIFYFPRFSHPDPTVKRRSGFLVPSFSDSSTVGPAFSIPYYWTIARDKDVTITPRIYSRERPLMLAEYRQDFKNSYLIVDTGYTQGYKKKTNQKSSGSRSHFFSKYSLNIIDEENKNSNLEINFQNVSNDTYLKIHDISTSLVDDEINIIEKTINYDYQDEDLFFGATLSAFDDLTVLGNRRYEYLAPYLNLEKKLLTSEKYGLFNLDSKLRVRNYQVNKQTEFFVNDINWKSNKWINKIGLENQLEGKFKTVNYNAKNSTEYKTDTTTSELSGAIAYLAKLGLFKNDNNLKKNYLLTPKLYLRYAPGHMRRVESGKLKYSNLYEINKINEIDVIENGLSATLGVEYEKNSLNSDGSLGNNEFSFAVGQTISEKTNMDIPSSTSLDQKISDMVGQSTYKMNNNINLNYKFSLDHNYRDFNYNEIGSDVTLGKTKFNISYLEESSHVGNQEYLTSNVDFQFNDSSSFSFATKRNLLSNSADFYNLSYQYINDCFKAGVLYRREFYTDRDIEPENSLMFKITIVPFGNISSPTFSK